MLNNKNIIVAVSGGIAAYKSAELVRLLRQAGANVQVVMTRAAHQFITPLTLQALSGHPVRDSLFSLEAENAMSHIELARWADQIIIAPATANTIAQLAHGFADDLLSTLCLATTAQVALVPAMNQGMWHHPLTRQNIKRLTQHRYLIWGPASGEQACGDVGWGRMLEPAQIIQQIMDCDQSALLNGKSVLITAGATREALDPVRCLSNISSGKMGYALAEVAYAQGAKVILVSGPTALSVATGVERVDIDSATQMYEAVMSRLKGVDLFIAAAAVTDYRPAHYSDQKIKKSSADLLLKLELNLDILSEVSRSSERPACVVGFAAETENLIENAQKKLREKQLDFIIANLIGEGQAMESDNNAAVLINRDGVTTEFQLMPKCKLAREVILAICKERARS